MGTRHTDRRSSSTYPVVMHKLCQEEDVFIIPEFVILNENLHSPKKFKEYGDEKLDSQNLLEKGYSSEEYAECPPQVWVAYEPPEDLDNPVAVTCKRIYMEYSLIQAIGRSLKPFSTLTTLKIEDCCLGKEAAEGLAAILAEGPGKQVTDLSLDGNENLIGVLPLFLHTNGLRCLSLQKCSIDDEEMEVFSKALEFSEGREHTLQVLNLGLNKIGDEGAGHLARALRTNRSLIWLSLAGNRIGDSGALRLVEVLQKFPLMHEEVMGKRRRVFGRILKKKAILERLLAEWKMRGDVDSQGSKGSAKSEIFVGRKVRGADGKIRCLSSRDRKKKSLTRANSTERSRGKFRPPAGQSLEPTPDDMAAIEEQVEEEMPPDRHPFVIQSSISDGEVWCSGCWSLGSLNLAFNYLTEKSVNAFADLLLWQTNSFNTFPRNGLFRLFLKPGNSFSETSEVYEKLQNAIKYHKTRKDSSSVASTSRRNSSAVKVKNR